MTYNRRTLLEGTLQSLQQQTYPIGRILVIDNASTDGTEEFLKSVQIPGLEVLRMTSNLGGAGGFSAGIAAAYQRGFDLVWVMDDDVLPAPDALATLVDALGNLRLKGLDPTFLIPAVVNSEGEPVNAPVIDQRLEPNGNLPLIKYLADGIIPVVSASFVGPLITRDAIAQHGLPIAEMFIWGDDTEYTFRLTRDRQAGYVIGKSKIVHLGRAIELSLARQQDPKLASRYYYFYRNGIYNIKKYGNKSRIAAFGFSIVSIFFQLLFRGDFFRLSILVKGLAAGLFFNPAIKPAP